MENPGIPGEYGLVGVLFVLIVLGGVLSVLGYAALRLSLKNPDDVP